MSEASPTVVNGKPVEEVRAEVLSIVLELSPQEEASGTEESRLVDDLGYHSLALLELAFALEDRFDLEPIDQERADQIFTVGDIADVVVEELAAR